MEQNDIYTCLYNDIGKSQIKMGRDEQLRHLRNYQDTGSEKSLELIVKANLKCIESVVSPFLRSRHENGIHDMDLYGAAMEEAVTCLKRYDFDKGESSVTSWIRNSVYMAVRNFKKNCTSTIRQPVSAFDRNIVKRKMENKYFLKNGHYPAIGQTMFDVNKKENYVFRPNTTVSIVEQEHAHEISFDEEHDDMFETPNDYLKSYMLDVINDFSFREQQIIESLYYNNNSVRDTLWYITPNTEQEFSKVEKRSANVFHYTLNGKNYETSIYYAGFNIDFQKKGTFLRRDKYYTNDKIFNFSLKNNVVIFYNDNQYTGLYDKENRNFVYNIILEKQVRPCIATSCIKNMHSEILDKLRANIINKMSTWNL